MSGHQSMSHLQELGTVVEREIQYLMLLRIFNVAAYKPGPCSTFLPRIQRKQDWENTEGWRREKGYTGLLRMIESNLPEFKMPFRLTVPVILLLVISYKQS